MTLTIVQGRFSTSMVRVRLAPRGFVVRVIAFHVGVVGGDFADCPHFLVFADGQRQGGVKQWY